MRRISTFARPGQRRNLRRALALALAGSAHFGFAAVASPAAAQEKQEDGNSEAFAKLYEPVAAIANSVDGDYAGAKAQLPPVLAAIQTPSDRFLAGNLALLLGNKLTDPVLQRKGLELMVESGRADPAQLGQLQYFVGSLAYDAQDWAAARTALQAATAAGYVDENVPGLIAESYFKEGLSAQGLDYLKGMIETRAAAGQQIPESWLLRGLKVAYDARLGDKATEWSVLLVEHNPTEQNWLQALQVVRAVNGLEEEAQLDILRLMALTDTLSQRREFESYIQAADPRIMANEVARVLEAGVQKGVFAPGDAYYDEVKSVVDQRAPADRAEAPTLAAEARSSGQPRDAQSAGDVLFSLGEFAQAEEMFKLAIDNGGTNRDQLLTRIGIAQVRQGKLDEARTTFGQVSGARQAVARMWTAYIESRA